MKLHVFYKLQRLVLGDGDYDLANHLQELRLDFKKLQRLVLGDMSVSRNCILLSQIRDVPL